ncbi:MAG: DUF4426 domain-containing protein [Gammaproteobacteria bacterium]|jgi:hypothetical protein
MSPRRFLACWLAGVALLLPLAAAAAENMEDFGDYVIHFNAMPTDMLPPQTAREYHITRSRTRGMLTITVLKKILGSPGQPVHARVDVTARNLAGQGRNIRMRQIREGNAIYYIGEFGVAHEETLKFDIRARPQGSMEVLNIEFSQDFYTQ